MRRSRESKPITPLNRTQIARVIFTAAESMGMSDRAQIERLTSQVIERLERPQTLPGMEHLVAGKQQRHRIPDFEILAMVKEFLAGEEPAQEEKIQPKREELAMPVNATSGISLTENALRVLE